MNILIIYNPESDSGLCLANKVSDILSADGIDIKMNEFCKHCEPVIPQNTNVVIVIGGDGTIIKVAKTAAMFNCPILGINAGHLGYLASVAQNELDIIKRLLTDEYSIEERCMIKVEKFKNGKFIDSCECLNDAVISKDALSNMIDIKLNIGNDSMEYRADGIIAATPTGSTAYSLSAGGPVVDPEMKCIILTPVCPHTLVTRSMVVDGSKPISISVKGKSDKSINLLCDGRIGFLLDEESTVNISISKTTAKFIKLNDVSVYKILSVKTDNY